MKIWLPCAVIRGLQRWTAGQSKGTVRLRKWVTDAADHRLTHAAGFD
jgi:hypothetical protein